MTLIPLALVLPLLAAALIACLGDRVSDAVLTGVGVAASVATTGFAAALMLRTAASGEMVAWFGGWRPHDSTALGICFVANPASCALIVLGGILTSASLTYGLFYFEEVSRLFATLVLVFLAAIVGYCLSGDLFTLFVFFELMATAAYALTAYQIEGTSLAGGIGFAVINSLGASLLLWGIALLYGRFGALNLAQLGQSLKAAHDVPPAYLGAALALVASGFLVKAAVVPFHFWHADADAVAPTPVCVLISGIMAELGLYGLARVYYTVFAPRLGLGGAPVWHLLLWVGAVTVLVGGIMCFRQLHAKRLLAFSTISHVGIMLCGLAIAGSSGGVAAAGGAGLYLLAHGPVKAALFLGTGIVLNRLGSVEQADLHGRGGGMWVTATLFGVAAVGLLGLPPFGTFAGRSMIEEAGRSAGMPWLHWVITAGEALTGAAVLRFAASVFLGWGEPERRQDCTEDTDDGTSRDLPRVMAAVAWALLLVPAAIAWVPGLSAIADAAARQVMDEGGYARLVLDGAASHGLVVAPGNASPALRWSILEAPLAAACLLVLALWGSRLRARLGRFGSAVARGWAIVPGRLIGVLQAVHLGFVGDYATWLVAGVAGLAAAFTYSF